MLCSFNVWHVKCYYIVTAVLLQSFDFIVKVYYKIMFYFSDNFVGKRILRRYAAFSIISKGI